jgi:hypothetical protein
MNRLVSGELRTPETFLYNVEKMPKPLKFNYEGKEALYAKYILSELTLRDVLYIVLRPSFPYLVAVYPEHAASYVGKESNSESLHSFEVEGEELHIFNKRYYESWETRGIRLWIDINQKVRVREDEIEVKPLKGTKNKTVRIKFIANTKKEKTISILRRTMPNQD